VHLGQSGAPCGDGDPESTGDDYGFGREVAEEPGSARVLVRPECECDAERGDEDQPRASADHCATLLGTLLGATLLLALQLFVSRRWLGRESFELALDFL